jgi:tRNA threonylcarbamoyladenosine biosynthesis protein TsaB
LGFGQPGLARAPSCSFREFRKMPSLSHILSQNASLLLLDASSERIQVGLLGDGSPRWASRTDEAGVGVFDCLDALGVEIGSVPAFAFCEGPGSILGIRTTAMALRTWNILRERPLFAYVSLAVVAQAVGRPEVSFIADARRSHWHRFRLGGSLERVPAEDLDGEMMSPDGFRHWEPLPEGTAQISYDLASLFSLPAVADADLFLLTDAPDAFLHEEPSYAKWVPQIHRAP